LGEGSVKYGVAIHAWVFMSSHTHLRPTPTSGEGISRPLQYLGRLYVSRFNYR
jgi:putative transposase